LKHKKIEFDTLERAQKIINELYGTQDISNGSEQILNTPVAAAATVDQKPTDVQMRECTEIINRLNKELAQANKRIEELSLELLEKRSKNIVRWSQDIEISEDKIITVFGTCYCGGFAEDHILLIDLKDSRR
jgi:hypothetical protein